MSELPPLPDYVVREFCAVVGGVLGLAGEVDSRAPLDGRRYWWDPPQFPLAGHHGDCAKVTNATVTGNSDVDCTCGGV